MASERNAQRADGQASAAQGGGVESDAPSEQVLRETREAGLRAQGGGTPDEDAIREAAEEAEEGS